jgi:pimeloyl-ACP methyl ester carboxylesterase
MIERLAQEFGIIGLDHRGTGASDARLPGYSPADHTGGRARGDRGR